MAVKKTNAAKLGAFVLAGLGFLILLLYVIGKNQDLFGSTFLLKARFGNVRGLVAGNNIRFAGIDAGSVKSVDVLNDTTIEVILLVKTKMKSFIHRNAQVSIGTDGFIGNKVVNIEPAKTPSPVVEEGDVLWGDKGADTEEMLKVLSNTNKDIAAIAGEIRQSVKRINQSKVIWGLLEDESLPLNIRESLRRIRSSSAYMQNTMQSLSLIVDDVKKGKGSLGKLLKDSSLALSASQAMEEIKKLGAKADTLSSQISGFVASVKSEMTEGKGPVHALLKDEDMTRRLANTLQNIEQDTQSFGEVLEALKQSFLFKGYFRKQQKLKSQPASGKRNY